MDSNFIDHRTYDETPGMDQTIGQAAKRWAGYIGLVLAMIAGCIGIIWLFANYTDTFMRVIWAGGFAGASVLFVNLARDKRKAGRGSRILYWFGGLCAAITAINVAGLMG